MPSASTRSLKWKMKMKTSEKTANISTFIKSERLKQPQKESNIVLPPHLNSLAGEITMTHLPLATIVQEFVIGHSPTLVICEAF